MRLINADDFNIYTATHQELIMSIENAPIVYDLNEVIKQVQEITDRILNYCEEIDNNIPEEERSGYKLLPDIFKIMDVLRRGGMDE